jgi:hypothetical protein
MEPHAQATRPPGKELRAEPALSIRASASARMMVIQGWLLIAVAAIHLAMTNEIGHIVSIHTTMQAFAFLWPPYELDHVVVAVLLAALGIMVIVCAKGIRAGERRVWWIALVTALAIFCMSPAIALTVGVRYFADAPPLLIAAVALGVLGIWMLVPLLWVRKELFRTAAALGPGE